MGPHMANKLRARRDLRMRCQHHYVSWNSMGLQLSVCSQASEVLWQLRVLSCSSEWGHAPHLLQKLLELHGADSCREKTPVWKTKSLQAICRLKLTWPDRGGLSQKQFWAAKKIKAEKTESQSQKGMTSNLWAAPEGWKQRRNPIALTLLRTKLQEFEVHGLGLNPWGCECVCVCFLAEQGFHTGLQSHRKAVQENLLKTTQTSAFLCWSWGDGTFAVRPGEPTTLTVTPVRGKKPFFFYFFFSYLVDISRTWQESGCVMVSYTSNAIRMRELLETKLFLYF